MMGIFGCASAPPPSSDTEAVPLEPAAVTVATFNVSMYESEEGALLTQLDDVRWERARGAASVLRTVRPDVVLLNEVDFNAADPEGAMERLRANFLMVDGGEGEPLDLPYGFVAPSNTGSHSGLDLNQDGRVTSEAGSDAYGGDAWGYGRYPGQYAMVVLSKYPIDSVNTRTFQEFLWSSMPENRIPTDFYGADISERLRLSSKSHWDVVVNLPNGADLHLLASHPTPPGFDGDEDRNGRRNQDEIRFWTDYIEGDAASYHRDDAGGQGGLRGSHFVVVGDLNADPNDGDGAQGAISDLVGHALVWQGEPPASAGAVEQADRQGGANRSQVGDPAFDTADWSDDSIGNLRVDYALPSATLTVDGSGVFWPLDGAAGFEWVGRYPFPVSDHRMVWVELQVPAP
jgi:hypothetical protein